MDERITSTEDERSGNECRSVDRWSDEVVVVRCERELSAWMDTTLLWADCASDCGSLVVKSESLRETRRARYFALLSSGIEAEVVVLRCGFKSW